MQVGVGRRDPLGEVDLVAGLEQHLEPPRRDGNCLAVGLDLVGGFRIHTHEIGKMRRLFSAIFALFEGLGLGLEVDVACGFVRRRSTRATLMPWLRSTFMSGRVMATAGSRTYLAFGELLGGITSCALLRVIAELAHGIETKSEGPHPDP